MQQSRTQGVTDRGPAASGWRTGLQVGWVELVTAFCKIRPLFRLYSVDLPPLKAHAALTHRVKHRVSVNFIID